ncbi:MAG TPA: DUF1705 domain-containing protein, partial [Thermoanaerobaculia bacterium]|nr:DUF1705 domain-containing protein [Thermoanaerobaculia bacterium]
MKRRFEISPPALAVCAAGFFVLFGNARFWAAILRGHSAGSPSSWLIAITTGALLLGLHFLLLLPFTGRRVLQPFLTVLLLANAAAVHFMERFGVIFDASMMRNVFQTDAREAADLITPGLFASLFLLGVLPAVAVWMVGLRNEPLAAALRRRAAFVAAALLLVTGAGLVSYKSYASFFRNHREARFMVPPISFVASGIGVGMESLRA